MHWVPTLVRGHVLRKAQAQPLISRFEARCQAQKEKSKRKSSDRRKGFEAADGTQQRKAARKATEVGVMSSKARRLSRGLLTLKVVWKVWPLQGENRTRPTESFLIPWDLNHVANIIVIVVIEVVNKRVRTSSLPVCQRTGAVPYRHRPIHYGEYHD